MALPIVFNAPGMDDFATFLANGPELQEFAFRVDVDTDFFFEFAQRSSEEFFARFNLALGNGPVAIIATCKKGATGMGQENFQLPIAKPEHQQSGADSRPHRLILLRWQAEPSGLLKTTPSPSSSECPTRRMKGLV